MRFTLPDAGFEECCLLEEELARALWGQSGRGKEGDVENGEAGHLPGSFCLLITGKALQSCFLKCLSSKVTRDRF